MLKPSFLPTFLLLLFALALMVACGAALSQVFLSMRAPALLGLLPR